MFPESMSSRVCAEHSGLAADVRNLVGWQKNQNGTIKELRNEQRTILYLLLGQLLALAANLVARTI